jgi:uncharacterized protein YndB with AHSA1/START domain/DNA-binding transcriptional ArsR family regulator
MEAVFRALADVSRRQLLDELNQDNGQSMKDLCTGLDMSRQAVAKHLAVLEAAGLITTLRRGREKLHYLNPAPINEIADRWISRYDRARVAALSDLKRALEDAVVDKPAFVYVTYIQTTAEQLWEALIDPAFTVRYWGSGPRSDWVVGSPVEWLSPVTGDFEDLGQFVLEADRPHRLAYTWVNYQEMHKVMFGWSDEQLAELRKEQISKVTFELEQHGTMVKLTVIHDGFEGDTEMYRAVSQGWPALIAKLKTMLETGTAPDWQGEVAPARRA